MLDYRFFFSSRRRHTRSLCDWSSDVCSSDLVGEALANAIRHGEASTVRIDVTNHEVACRLRIVDDGLGFQPGEGHHTRGFGLISMRERAAAIGGELHVRSRLGVGTEVEVVLP